MQNVKNHNHTWHGVYIYGDSLCNCTRRLFRSPRDQRPTIHQQDQTSFSPQTQIDEAAKQARASVGPTHPISHAIMQNFTSHT